MKFRKRSAEHFGTEGVEAFVYIKIVFLCNLCNACFVLGMKWDSLDSELLMGFEELDVDEDIREEFPCPFCSEYFDIVGLCIHIDEEHHAEAKNGVLLSSLFCIVDHQCSFTW